MITNPYVDFHSNPVETSVYENLIQEYIRFAGINVYYIPRITDNVDTLMKDDPTSRFTQGILVDFLVKNSENLGGGEAADLLSKFGIAAKDRITFVVSKRTFGEEITHHYDEIIRPREGDLIYIPMNGAIFEIEFVEHESIYYGLGKVFGYELVCEKFSFDQEVFETGIPELDLVMIRRSIDSFQYAVLDENDNRILDERGDPIIGSEYIIDNINVLAENEFFKKEALQFLDFTRVDPFSEGHI